MPGSKHFPAKVLAAIDSGKILGIRPGDGSHRLTGVWVVVVAGRVFCRSWTIKKDGWFHAFLDNPRGAISIHGREIPIRAVHTRSERLKDAVERAYATKYHTPGAQKYVRGFRTKRRRDATIGLAPAKSVAIRR